MKIMMRRRHTVRPEDYEAVELTAQVEIDPSTEQDQEFRGMDIEEIADYLSENLDALLDSDVDRTLRLDGQHIGDTHLWVFYDKDESEGK